MIPHAVLAAHTVAQMLAPLLAQAAPTPTPLPAGFTTGGAGGAAEATIPLDAGLKWFIKWLIFFADGAGALVIGIAAVRALAVYLIDLILHAGRAVPKELVRLSLGRALALALEFQLGADILGTALDPTTKDLIVLGAIVILRTILNFFLGRELQEGQRLLAEQRVGSRAAGLTSWLLATPEPTARIDNSPAPPRER